MALSLALSPLLVVALGAMLLMLAEAFQRKKRRDSGLALVATARYFVTPCSSMTPRRCRKAFTAFFRISSLNRWRTNTPSPRRKG